jgi:hypothetical protein
MGSFVPFCCKEGKTHEKPLGPNARGEFEPGCTRGTYHARRVRLFPNENNRHEDEFDSRFAVG